MNDALFHQKTRRKTAANFVRSRQDLESDSSDDDDVDSEDEEVET
jgi:hypothetical protein